MRTLAILAALIITACSQPKPQTQTCKNEAVIMIVSGDTLDRARMGEYAKALGKSGLYPKVGGYYLNNPRPVDIFEGDVPESYVTLMVRFPSLEKAREFWDSETYQTQIKPIRLNPSAGDYKVTVYKEADMPAYMVGKVQPGTYSCE